jgi:hypothetical protein
MRPRLKKPPSGEQPSKPPTPKALRTLSKMALAAQFFYLSEDRVRKHWQSDGAVEKTYTGSGCGRMPSPKFLFERWFYCSKRWYKLCFTIV